MAFEGASPASEKAPDTGEAALMFNVSEALLCTGSIAFPEHTGTSSALTRSDPVALG
jgi:hypothetical protein